MPKLPLLVLRPDVKADMLMIGAGARPMAGSIAAGVRSVSLFAGLRAFTDGEPICKIVVGGVGAELRCALG